MLSPKFSESHELGYGLSQEAHFAMKDLRATINLISTAFDPAPGDTGLDIDGDQVAAMLRTFGRAMDHILDNAPDARIHAKIGVQLDS